jgi:hypothetical protein
MQARSQLRARAVRELLTLFVWALPGCSVFERTTSHAEPVGSVHAEPVQPQLAPTQLQPDSVQPQPTEPLPQLQPEPAQPQLALSTPDWPLFAECDTSERSFRARVRPRRRSAATLEAIQRVLGDATPICEPSGDVELYVSAETLTRLFGAQITLQCFEGMGNRVDSPSYVATITPDGYLPVSLTPHVRRMEMDNDPKSELVGEAVDCGSRFR